MTQVDVLDDVVQLAGNEIAVDDDVVLVHIRRFKGDVLQDFFQHSMQTAGADVFRFQIDAMGVFSNSVDAVVSEFQLYAVCRQQGRILLDEGLVRLGQDLTEIVDRQGLKLYADRKAALQFRDEVAG